MTAPQFALAHADRPDKVDLWCEHEGLDDQGRVKFLVWNGLWQGAFDGDTLEITDTSWAAPTGKKWPAKQVWQGEAPFGSRSYNEAIAWIQDKVTNPPAPTDGAAEGYMPWEYQDTWEKEPL